MLIEGSHYFSYEAQRLLADREISELTEAEFISLLRSYNHVGAHEAAEHVSRMAADSFPESIELARWRSSCLLSSSTDFDLAQAEHLARVEAKSMHSKFYLIALADHLVALAWGQNEYFIGDVAEEPAYLDVAANLLSQPGVVGYYNEYLQEGGVNGGAPHPISFQEYFEPLYRFKRYPLPTS